MSKVGEQCGVTPSHIVWQKVHPLTNKQITLCLPAKITWSNGLPIELIPVADSVCPTSSLFS